jgi:putative SOS response-associated peptidase YedK
VADGFYEWQKTGSKMQPFYIRLADGAPFGFAGLWEHWKRDGQEIESCTILTTDANELMAAFADVAEQRGAGFVRRSTDFTD